MTQIRIIGDAENIASFFEKHIKESDRDNLITHELKDPVELNQKSRCMILTFFDE